MLFGHTPKFVRYLRDGSAQVGCKICKKLVFSSISGYKTGDELDAEWEEYKRTKYDE